MTYNQAAPFTVQIDLATGCNIRVPRPDGTKGLCWACGLNGIRSGPGNYEFMSLATASKIALQIKDAGWNSQLLFAGFGEPSMNPQMHEIIRIFRGLLPKQYMVMLSNGAGFIREGSIAEIFKAGLTTLALEDYEGGLFDRVRVPVGMELMHYPSDKEANPHHRSKAQRLVVIDDIKDSTKGTHSVLNNHAGSGLPPKRVQARCAKVFREVAVKSDGVVSICCIDWRRETEFGNVNTTPLPEIWQNEMFNAARRILITGDRSQINLCSKCDHPSYRVGLLPDKFGKEKLPPYTEEDVALIQSARPAKAVTIVLRPWEK